MIISAYGMCASYFHSYRDGTIDLDRFYGKRFQKIFPFLFMLVCLDVVVHGFRLGDVAEGFLECIFLQGFLPNNNLGVIGVSWTLGIIFLFYYMFGYFVYLMGNKMRAWLALFLSVAAAYVFEYYFIVGKFEMNDFMFMHHFFYCAPYFLAGGIIYLYEEKLRTFWEGKAAAATVCMTVGAAAYYLIPDAVGGIDIILPKTLLLWSMLVIFAICVKNVFLGNRVMVFLSGISLEMYLSHMVMFRIFEKCGLIYFFGNGWLGYVLFCAVLIGCLIAGILAYKRIEDFIRRKWRDVKCG